MPHDLTIMLYMTCRVLDGIEWNLSLIQVGFDLSSFNRTVEMTTRQSSPRFFRQTRTTITVWSAYFNTNRRFVDQCPARECLIVTSTMCNKTGISGNVGF